MDQRLEKLKQSILSKKKGLSLGSLPQIFYIVMLIGAFAGATYIFIDAFNSTLDDGSAAQTGMGYILDFVNNITENLGTLGIIIFIVLLVSTVMLLQRYRGKGGA